MKLYKEAVNYRNSLFYSQKMPGLKIFKGNKLATAGRVILNDMVQKIFESVKNDMINELWDSSEDIQVHYQEEEEKVENSEEIED